MKRVELEDFKEYITLSSVNIHNDDILFIETSIDLDNNKYKNNLMLLKDGKKIKLISNDEACPYQLEGDDIIFIQARTEEEKERCKKEAFLSFVYKLSLLGGEAEKIFELPLKASKLVKYQDKYIVQASIDYKYADYHLLSKEDKEKVDKEIKENEDVIEISQSPFYSNGSGFINRLRSALFLFDPTTNNLQLLTDKYMDVSSFEIVDNDIYFIGASYKELMPLETSINKIRLLDFSCKEILKPQYNVSKLFKVEDKIIFLASHLDKYSSPNPYFYLLDPIDDSIKLINQADESLYSVLTDIEYGSTRSFKVDGKFLYFLSTVRFFTLLRRIDIEGNMETIIEKEGLIADFDVLNGKVVVSAFYNMRLPELYTLNKTRLQKLTSINQKYLDEHFVSRPIYIHTFDGEDIDGFVMNPYNYDPNKKYPAILDIHGGPKCAYGRIYFHEMQAWAGQGYFVMYCNPHGSDGKGVEFAYLDGKWGETDYHNIMAFVDNALKQYPNIDPDNLFCTGGSYGGYMSNWILTHTDRFKAIATQRSFCNWLSMYGVGDISPINAKESTSHNPYSLEGFDDMFRQSPIKYITNAKTPTLIIHSEEDYRCPVSEGYQLFTALTYLKVPTKMVLFKKENHELSRSGEPKHRLRRLQEITNWFNQYFKK